METKKCIAETCSCAGLVELGGYCSPSCVRAEAARRNGDEPLDYCTCEHPSCTGVPEVEPEAMGLLIASEGLAS